MRPETSPARRWRLEPQGFDARVLRSLLVAGSFLIIAKLIGLSKELVLAAKYGVEPINDAYNISFVLVTWPVAVWASIASALFIPVLASKFARSEGAAADAFGREALGLTLVIAVAVTAAMAIVVIWPVALEAFTGGQAVLATLVRRVLPPLLLLAPLGMVAGLQAAWLMAQHRHVNSLIDGVPALVLALFILLAVFVDDPVRLAWGTVAGFGAQVVLLDVTSRKHRLRLMPRFRFPSERWTPIWRGFAVLAVSQAVLAASTVVDQVMVTGIGESANSVLGYANRLLLLALGLLSAAVSRAILPVLSEVMDIDRRRRLAWRWAGILFGAGCVAVVLGSFLAEPVTRLIYERGAFGPGETEAVSAAVRLGLLQLPVFAAGIVMAQYVSASRAYGLFLVANILVLALKILLNGLLLHMGVSGVMLSTAAMYTASLVILVGASILLKPRVSTEGP